MLSNGGIRLNLSDQVTVSCVDSASMRASATKILLRRCLRCRSSEISYLQRITSRSVAPSLRHAQPKNLTRRSEKPRNVPWLSKRKRCWTISSNGGARLTSRILFTLGFQDGRREGQGINGDHHCVHGTYIGDPWGADYMCGRCEDGWTCGHFDIFPAVLGCSTCRRIARGDLGTGWPRKLAHAVVRNAIRSWWRSRPRVYIGGVCAVLWGNPSHPHGWVISLRGGFRTLYKK